MNRKGTIQISTLKFILYISVLLGIVLGGCSSKPISKHLKINDSLTLNKEAIKVTDKFINYLFDNNSERAGELSLGVVKFNILSNKIDIKSDFSIDKINSELSFTSDNLLIVNSTVEYIDNIKNEYDVVFYEVKLLKEEDMWKVYHLEEKDPVFNYSKNNSKSRNLVDEFKGDEVKNVFYEYIEMLSEGGYEESSKSLIGRAKKMHNKANPALNQLNLVSKVTDLESNIIYQEKKIAISKFNYINNDRPLSVLVYFYLTGQGWRIYNVNQV